MKPIINHVSAPCSHCSKKFTHEVHFRIDGQGYPALKAKVFDYSAFVSPCPNCLGLSSVPQDFRYFDQVGDIRYMIYYFPVGSERKLDDVIAATICLRENGTKVHMVHKISEILAIIQSYEEGDLPPERIIEPSDGAMTRAKAQASQVRNSMNAVFDAMKTQKETGQLPPEFVKRVSDGFDLMKKRDHKKRSFFRRLFGG